MEMMSWIRKFYTTYVKAPTSVAPERSLPSPLVENFFDTDEGYQEFLLKTVAMANSAAVITTIDDSYVQRSPENKIFLM
jgi:hypothetical protein